MPIAVSFGCERTMHVQIDLSSRVPMALGANNSSAEYLFHKHEASDYDLGDKSLQCGRRADALKLWLSWKRHGIAGFEQRIDTAYDNAAYIAAEIKKRTPTLALVVEPMSCNIAFWYIPASKRPDFATGG